MTSNEQAATDLARKLERNGTPFFERPSFSSDRGWEEYVQRPSDPSKALDAILTLNRIFLSRGWTHSTSGPIGLLSPRETLHRAPRVSPKHGEKLLLVSEFGKIYGKTVKAPKLRFRPGNMLKINKKIYEVDYCWLSDGERGSEWTYAMSERDSVFVSVQLEGARPGIDVSRINDIVARVPLVCPYVLKPGDVYRYFISVPHDRGRIFRSSSKLGDAELISDGPIFDIPESSFSKYLKTVTYDLSAERTVDEPRLLP